MSQNTFAQLMKEIRTNLRPRTVFFLDRFNKFKIYLTLHLIFKIYLSQITGVILWFRTAK